MDVPNRYLVHWGDVLELDTEAARELSVASPASAGVGAPGQAARQLQIIRLILLNDCLLTTAHEYPSL